MSQAFIQPSPLQLERYYVKELSCAVRDSFIDRQDQQGPYSSPRMQANLNEEQIGDDPRHWRFELMVSSNDDGGDTFPYQVHVVLVGYFRVAEHYPEARVSTLARVNGPAVLYSAAREALVMLTSRTGYPGLMLPTIYFSPPPHDEAHAELKQLSGTESAAEAASATEQPQTPDGANRRR
jgi:preprotein translocase subunit SecB